MAEFETIYSYLAKYLKFFEWLKKTTAYIETFFLYFPNLIIFSTEERKNLLSSQWNYQFNHLLQSLTAIDRFSQYNYRNKKQIEKKNCPYKIKFTFNLKFFFSEISILIMIKTKLSLCHKLKFFNPYIFAARWSTFFYISNLYFFI